MKASPAVDIGVFFREATLRICGSLEIEHALWQLMMYLREFIPCDKCLLNHYDRDSAVMLPIANATTEGGVLGGPPYPINFELLRNADPGWEPGQPQPRVINDVRASEAAMRALTDLGFQAGSLLTMPLEMDNAVIGGIGLMAERPGSYRPRHVELLKQLRRPLAVAMTNGLRYRRLREMKDALDADYRNLQSDIQLRKGTQIVGADFGLRETMSLARQVAHLNSPVLILGETGTGKEVVANAIHNLSPRREKPFITVNCGAIPATLIDSELFGHERGSFTGAVGRKRGRFERAEGGTIFLDEVGELPLDAQVRLLRVMQEREFERVGGTQTLHADIRVIAATHRDLEAMVADGRFRRDLFFRLRVFPISLPPLIDRRGDIPALVHHFIQKKSAEMGLRGDPRLAPGALDRLMDYRWPGNVRELENAVERALILAEGGPLGFDFIPAGPPRELAADEPQEPAAEPPRARRAGPASAPGDPGEDLRLDAVSAAHIRRVLEMAGGKVGGPGGAAELLGINPGTLRHRMRKLGVVFGRKCKG